MRDWHYDGFKCKESNKGAEGGYKKAMRVEGSRQKCWRNSSPSESERDRPEVGDKVRE